MKTTLSFDVEIEHEGDLNVEELKVRFIEPVKEGIRTAAALGPDNLESWETIRVHSLHTSQV